MTYRITRKIKRVQDRISKQIHAKSRNSKYSRGLAYEGYEGGYLAALDDVLMALNGGVPNRNGWWVEEEKGSSGVK